jgi:iron complex outermembrane recepter protein
MKCVRFAFLALAAALIAVGGYAQATGTIEGTIVDETQAPLPGVTVEATSPNLRQSKFATSDTQGMFRLEMLPAGPYTVRFTLQGFATQEQTNLAVAAGRVVTLQVQMRSAYKEEVAVTGSLIPRPTLEALSPVSTLNVEQLTYQGNTRLEDLLTSLPQVFSAQNSTVSNGSSGTATVSLRNLGANRTLVLIDGRRAPISDASAADLNFIPAALVKRVDILTGGASATYGADAVAGVVNFILDKDFEGIRAGISGGGYEHDNSSGVAARINQARGFSYPTGQAWDGGQVDAYVAFGGKFAEGKGHAAVYLDYRKEAALKKDRRDYTNCSVSTLGGTGGPACGGSSTSPTGRFFLNDGSSYTVDPTTGNTFVPWSTSKYAFNYAPYNFLQRPDQRYAAGGFINYDWNKHFQGYAQVMFMDDKTDAQIAPSGDFGNTTQINCDNPMLSPQEMQVICTDQGYGPHDIAYLNPLRRDVEGGPRADILSHQEWMLVAGLKGQIGGGWNYDIYGQHNENRTPENYINDFNINRIQEALLVTGDPNNPSTWQCTSGNPLCVPWDIFKKGGVTQAAVNYLELPLVSNEDITTQAVGGKVTADLTQSGAVFPSAVEGIQLALGTEYRKEALSFLPDLAYQEGLGAGQGSTTPPVVGSYDVKEAFVEAAIPIIQGARGAQDLRLDLGYRYSDYSTTGNQNTWKVAADYAPAADLKFRAGKTRATRSPNVNELFSPQRLLLGGSTDPCSNEVGATPEFTLAQCENTGVTPAEYGHITPSTANQYNTISGGSRTLQPETADTITFGVVITPQAMPGFNLTLDYYDIKIKSTIGAYSADDVLTTCGLTGNPLLCSLIHRDSRGSLWLSTSGYTTVINQNIGQRESEGIDVTAGYTIPAGNSVFSLNLIGSYLRKSFINTGLFKYDCVGWYGNICNDPYSDHVSMQPKWRHLFRASWETGNVVVSMGWRMIGAMKAEEASSQPALANASLIPALQANHALNIPAYNYIDLAFSYKFGSAAQFTLGVNNIADKEPPLGSGNSANDYATGFYGTYDPYGRFIHSSIQFTF